MLHPPLEVKAWGDLACFTRPEMKVERVSYPVMTPSAARGLLEAIFWKPEFRWLVREIWVLKPIRFFSMLRNEVNAKASSLAARGWSSGDGYFAEEDRAQRHTLALRDVEYVIRADIEVKEGVGEDVAKFRDQFRRRVGRGACAFTPYFGCREFVASFGPRLDGDRPADITQDLGRMLLDLDYADGSSRAAPHFFEAQLESGVLRVPIVSRVRA
ncbi:MAG TPA: type I-C CRISPR-associated protein Cas5c [Planctomycetota bacterium]|nr:type I-C CRISPR-associated protein Cas5c [Planctomycetota bacterium]